MSSIQVNSSLFKLLYNDGQDRLLRRREEWANCNSLCLKESPLLSLEEQHCLEECVHRTSTHLPKMLNIC